MTFRPVSYGHVVTISNLPLTRPTNMQTFLPLSDFAASAKVLDRQRLGKQRVEVLQLLKALLVSGSGWANHPAAKMWRGYEISLYSYGWHICREWSDRGYQDTCVYKMRRIVWDTIGTWVSTLHFADCPKPSWLGNPDFHASHRSNLLRKDPVWYGQFGWTEVSTLPYVWPVG